MDAIDKYIERLSDPKVLASHHMLLGVDEDEISDGDRPKTLEEHVLQAEKELGFALPPSYRKLVTTTDPRDQVYGLIWVWVDGLDIYGPDIVSEYNSTCNALPPFLIPVWSDDDGNRSCFDTRFVDERGEYRIVYCDHEIVNEDSTEFEFAAKDLGELLLRYVGGEASS